MIIIYDTQISFFQEHLLEWYSSSGRVFLWRKDDATNYLIIIAEIFLQRTRAETVNRFLPLFISHFPSWKELSEASLETIETILRPIGLSKQRGKRLYNLSQEIKKRQGKLPEERNEIEELPMMGQYLTNAYELYILNKKTPLLDVNMARVIERFFGNRKLADIRYDPYLQTLSYRIVAVENSKELNWAILDFAALICKKIKPKCNNCMLVNYCQYANNLLLSTKNKA